MTKPPSVQDRYRGAMLGLGMPFREGQENPFYATKLRSIAHHNNILVVP
jgi:hypothetical protein